jgi:dihydroxyacetone kinase
MTSPRAPTLSVVPAIQELPEVVLLVNNLGGMGELEMDTIAGNRDCGLTLKAGA